MPDNDAETVGKAHSNVKTILIVEDDVNIGEVLVQAVTQETPFFAILAADAFEALKVIEGVKPNLFILDYQLPRMNGVQLFDKLRTIKGLEQTPTIMISAQLPRQELEKRKIHGMNKPLDLDEFLQTIEDFLS